VTVDKNGSVVINGKSTVCDIIVGGSDGGS
jgi:hypothetical protein